MMYNRKVLLFLSLLLFQIILLKGQNNINDSCNVYSVCYSKIDSVKLNVYKSILLSKELKNNKQCHIIGIYPISLNINYLPGYNPYFYDIKKVEDSTSINNLKKNFPQSYKFYSINDKLSNSIENWEYIYYLEKLEKGNKLEDTYTLDYFYNEICEAGFDIIKIQEPLDNWAKVYKANILQSKPSVVIPVIYESFSDNPKYLLYKIELYEGSTKVKSVKTVELE